MFVAVGGTGVPVGVDVGARIVGETSENGVSVGVAVGVTGVGDGVIGVGDGVIGVGDGVTGVGDGVTGVGDGVMGVGVGVSVATSLS